MLATHRPLALGALCLLALAGCGSNGKSSVTTSTTKGPKPPSPKHIGQGADYSGAGDVGGKPVRVKLRMTPVSFTGKATAKGRQLARLQVRVKNLSPAPFKDAVGAFALTDKLGNLYTSVVNAAFQPSLAGAHGAIVIPAGATRTGFIGYRVPAATKITGFVFTSSITSDQLSWKIP